MKIGDNTGFEDWNLNDIHVGDTCKYSKATWKEKVDISDGVVCFGCITLEEACMYPIYIVKRWDEE